MMIDDDPRHASVVVVVVVVGVNDANQIAAIPFGVMKLRFGWRVKKAGARSERYRKSIRMM
jgi:hypothetical protein